MPNATKPLFSVLAYSASFLCLLPNPISAQLVDTASSVVSIVNVGAVDSAVNSAYIAALDNKIDNRNAQARAGTDGDSDGDSVPDVIDVDDDNDTIPDDVEGTGDSDMDGVADCLDVDSDNDGLTDLFEAVAGSGLLLLVDANGDGQLDATVAVGENGLADVVELSAESSTSQTANADFDGDGIRDYLDLDVDNDGIPDVVEVGSSDEQFDGRYDFFVDLDNDGLADGLLTDPVVPIDSDRDGVEDFRDLDSDQDGLTDRLETFGVDTDSDGQVDNLVDTNSDGLDDGYQSRATNMPDTDDDGYPDYRDTDSNGDGVSDTEEAFGSTNPNMAGNSSTEVSLSPEAQNEQITLPTGESGNVFGCTLSYGDRIKQPVDLVFLLIVAASLFIVRRRSSGLVATGRSLAMPFVASIMLFVAGCAIQQPSNPADAGALQPYAGIGLGASFLNADTSNLDDLDQDKSYSAAGQLTFGLSLDNRISLEARAADLGQATFTDGDAVGYQVADISTLYKRHFKQYAGFARLGVGALFNDGDIRTTQKNKVHLLVGFGAEYNFNSRVALRAEWQGHDVDVMHSQLSILYRFGANAKRATPLVVARNQSQNADTQKLSDSDFQSVPDKSIDSEPVAIGETALIAASPLAETTETEAEAAVPEPAPEPEATAGVVEPSVVIPEVEVEETAATIAQQESTSLEEDIDRKTPEATPDDPLALVTSQDKPAETESPESADSKPIQSENVATQVDADEDGVNDALDKCLGANAALSAVAVGCSLFEDLVPNLTFVSDTDQLTNSGEQVLDTVADGLAKESDVQVTVAVHTAPATDPNEAMFLTRRRTIAIIRYLSEKGIDATRLRPEAYGDTQPLADAKNPADNDRVVLSTR